MDTTHAPRRPLLRNRRDGKVAGVAAGLGDYFAIDPVLIRLGFLLLTLVGGLGVLAYLLAWLVIPAGDSNRAADAPTDDRGLSGTASRARWLLAVVLLGIGAVILADWFHLFWIDGPPFVAVLLVAAGAALLLWHRDGGPGQPPAAPPDSAGPAGDAGGTPAPDDPAEPPADAASVEADDAGTGPEPGRADDAASAAEPDEAAPAGPRENDEQRESPELPAGGEDDTRRLGPAPAVAALPPARFEAEPASAPRFAVPPPPPRRRRTLPLGLLLLATLVLSAVLAALLDVTGALDVSLQWFLVYAVGLGALAVVVSPWLGRARGPVALTAALAAALAVAVIVDVPLRGGIGERTVQPRSAAELEPEYRLGVGKLVVDLRSLAPDGLERRVEAGVGIGELLVLLPANAAAAVEGRTSVGTVYVFEESDRGIDAMASGLSPLSERAARLPVLLLDLEVGVGHLETRVVPSPPPGGTL